MPYTLTSVGAWVAHQRLRRPIIVSTALVQTRDDTDVTALERWSSSLEKVDPTRHAEGKRAVALVSDSHVALVVPFNWTPRLPLRKTALMTLPRPSTKYPTVAVTYDEGLVDEPTSSVELAPLPPAVLRDIYQDASARAAWWEDYTATNYGKVDVEQYERRVVVQNSVRQMKRNARPIDTSPYVRRLNAFGSSITTARAMGREFYDRDYTLWISERAFRIFADDKTDFDRHYVLVSTLKRATLSVIDRKSHLVVGLLQAKPDYVMGGLLIPS